MIPTEAINCPKCGAPIQVEKGNPITVCLFCESRVLVMLSQEQRLFGRVDNRPLDNDIRRQVKASLTGQMKSLRAQISGLQSEHEAALKGLRAQEQQRRVRMGAAARQKLLIYAVVVIPLVIVAVVLGLTRLVDTWIFSVAGAIFLFGLLGFIVFGMSSIPEREDAGDSEALKEKIRAVEAAHNEQKNLLEYRVELTQKLLEKVNKK